MTSRLLLSTETPWFARVSSDLREACIREITRVLRRKPIGRNGELRIPFVVAWNAPVPLKSVPSVYMTANVHNSRLRHDAGNRQISSLHVLVNSPPVEVLKCWIRDVG
jgi:hypothetical protein